MNSLSNNSIYANTSPIKELDLSKILWQKEGGN